MERFIVSARKYRPVTFETVVGQPGITQTLKNAIRTNHLAQAFLFTGPRGVGKTTTARILAKTINCENIDANVEACNVCESCIAFNEGRSFNIYELDAASNNSVEDIRALVEQVRYPPQMGRYKIYIIDEVHMLSTQAFNAFLKTLEEPPSYAIFILATTEKHKIIPTILSRCQIFDFNRISVEDIVKHLQHIASKEGVDAEEDALHTIAQKADGALRDSLSLFDQLVSFAGKHLTYKAVIQNLNILDYDYYFRVTDDLVAGNYSNVLLTFNEILNNGFDGHNFINGLASHFRDLLMCRDESTLILLEVSPNVRERYKVQAKFCESGWLLSQLDLAGKADVAYRNARNQRLLIELTLLKMCTSVSNGDTFKKKAEPSAELKINSPAKTQVNQPIAESLPVKPAPVVPEPVNQNTEHHAASSVRNTETPKTISTSPVQKTISISKKGPAEDQKKNPVTSEEQLPDLAKPFDVKTLEFYWRQFAEQLNKEGRMALHTAFQKRSPQLLDDFIIYFPVDNVSLEKDLVEIKTVLLAFLRKNLSNYKINLKSEVVIDDTKSEAYTPSEKFKKLAEQNPKLNDLKSKFDLDIDY
jgi:DNA polymerase-3 subunit gamma/tau